MKNQNVRRLLRCSSIDEFLSMFFGLPLSERLDVFTDSVIIPKGTLLYRARRDIGKNLTSKEDWELPPAERVDVGRFNKAKHPVLYVGTWDFVLPREIGLQVNDKYYLATYSVKEDIEVGSLLKTNDMVAALLHKVALTIENDNKLFEEEQKCLKDLDYKSKTLANMASEFISPLYIYKCLAKDLYEVTNKIADLVLKRYPNGIRYCSCYAPIELSGADCVLTLDGKVNGNYAITDKAVDKLEVINIKHKEYAEEDYKPNLCLMIETFLNEGNSNE